LFVPHRVANPNWKKYPKSPNFSVKSPVLAGNPLKLPKDAYNSSKNVKNFQKI
jgi:hypothetical protein